MGGVEGLGGGEGLAGGEGGRVRMRCECNCC